MIFSIFFFFNDTATTEIYTLSLHDALPISPNGRRTAAAAGWSWKMTLRLGDVQRDHLRHALAQHPRAAGAVGRDRKSTRLNSSHSQISYAVFCLKKKKA